MDDLDHMLNGKGSRQHHQDILRWTQHERLAHEVEAAQRRQTMGVRAPGIARRFLASLLDSTTALLNRRASRDADEAVQVNEQNFAQAADSK